MVPTGPILSVTRKPNWFSSTVSNANHLLTILCLIAEGELLSERLTYCKINMLGDYRSQLNDDELQKMGDELTSTKISLLKTIRKCFDHFIKIIQCCDLWKNFKDHNIKKLIFDALIFWSDPLELTRSLYQKSVIETN